MGLGAIMAPGLHMAVPALAGVVLPAQAKGDLEICARRHLASRFAHIVTSCCEFTAEITEESLQNRTTSPITIRPGKSPV